MKKTPNPADDMMSPRTAPAQFQYQGKTLREILQIKDSKKRQAMLHGYQDAYDAYLAEKAIDSDAAAGFPETPMTPKSGNLILLQPWADEKRPASNPLLRSALFGAIRPGKRRLIDWEKIPSLEGINLQGSGPRLDQNDLDVYMGLLHLHKRHPLGNEVRFKMSELLGILSLPTRGGGGPRGTRTVLHNRMDRLQRYAIRIQWGPDQKYRYQGSLIDSIAKSKEREDCFVLRLNPELKSLFEKNQYTLLDWNVRRHLPNMPLAQWLHAFYSSHQMPYPMNVEKIRDLSGSENGALFDFRREVREALSVLAKVSNWQCRIDKSDKVIIIKYI